MKKVLLFAALFCLHISLHAAPVDANKRAKIHFEEFYSDAQDPAWYQLSDKSIYCVFHKGARIERVFYDERGYWKYTLIGYPVVNLATDIRDKILSKFKGYEITYVNEIQSEEDDPVYIINIENADNIKIIRLVLDETDVQQSLSKR